MGVIAKLYERLRDKKAYYLKRRFDKMERFDKNILQPLLAKLDQRGTTRRPTFRHSGKLGDIIYSLPTVLALAGEESADFLIHGGPFLNAQSVEMLIPLLQSQPYIHTCRSYAGEEIDYDLDLFRALPINLDSGNIARWLFYIYGVDYDLAKPWLFTQPDPSYKERIVLSRGPFYRNETIKYHFMREYANIFFVGTRPEYQEMQKQIPRLEFAPVKDFLELAKIIAGCRFFIGNQSFPYSLAEALKVPRIVELSPQAPNVIPAGSNGFDFFFQTHLELYVGRLFNSTRNLK